MKRQLNYDWLLFPARAASPEIDVLDAACDVTTQTGGRVLVKI